MNARKCQKFSQTTMSQKIALLIERHGAAEVLERYISVLSELYAGTDASDNLIRKLEQLIFLALKLDGEDSSDGE
ncbi:MAG: hypothetical protein NVS2B14_08890 [Chamaesiphon sp.]